MEVEIVAVDDPAGLFADVALAERINELGHRSAVAQQLRVPITSTELFAKHAGAQKQQLLVAVVRGKAVGFLKTGLRHLFYVNRKGVYTELDPLCVLDFYVLEDFQRHGIGLLLFSRLLQLHEVHPAQLAYDRPSPKLLAFLKKHAQLTQFFAQPNNFVVFDDYFETKATQD